jgi:hypothetical protein
VRLNERPISSSGWARLDRFASSPFVDQEISWCSWFRGVRIELILQRRAEGVDHRPPLDLGFGKPAPVWIMARLWIVQKTRLEIASSPYANQAIKPGFKYRRMWTAEKLRLRVRLFSA